MVLYCVGSAEKLVLLIQPRLKRQTENGDLSSKPPTLTGFGDWVAIPISLWVIPGAYSDDQIQALQKHTLEP